MGERRLVKFFFGRSPVHPDERRLALLLFAYFFLITAPHTIIKALRTTNLLMKMGVGALPLAYLMAAIVTGLVVFLQARIQSKVSLRAMIVSGLLFFAGSGLALQAVLLTDFGRRSQYLSYLYWVWASVLIVVLMTHYWMLVNGIFNPREAKRLVGFLGSGGILGGVVGGLVAGFLTRADLAVLLFPLACALLLGCVLVVRSLFEWLKLRPRTTAAIPPAAAEREAPKAGFKDSFKSVRKSRYLRFLAIIVASGVIVSTFIEFQFLSAANHFYMDEKGLQMFLGFFLAGLTVFAFALNILLTSRVLKKLLTLAVLITPATLLLGSAAFLIVPFSLLPAVLLKGGDGSLTFSLNQSVREVLYIPVAADLKSRTKPFIDMFVSQVAKVAGAVVLLVFALSMNKGIEGFTPIFDPRLAQDLSWVAIGFLAMWILAGLSIHREYIEAIRKNIRIGADRGEKIIKQKVDAGAAGLIIDTVDPRNFSSVMFALNAFDLLEQKKLSPEVKRMIIEKAGEVRLAALNEMFGAEDATGHPGVPEAAGPESFAADIHEILSLEAYQKLMTLYAGGVLAKGKEADVEKMELAKAIGFMKPSAPLAEWLPQLIDDNSPDVSSIAIQSAARLKREDHIPVIINRLGHTLTRADAISALYGYGPSAIPALDASLSDTRWDTELRQGIVEVLARIGTADAVQVLGSALARGSGGLDPEIIDALDLIRSENEDMPMPAGPALAKIRSLVRQYCGMFLELQRYGPGERNDVRRRLLERELAARIADIFKLLGLSHPHADISNAYQNLWTPTHGHAVELLDNILKADVKDLVIPLVEDLDEAARARQFRKILKTLPED